MATSTNTQFAVAVHVLTYLAATADGADARPVSSAELSSSTNTNPVYVRRVLGPLREAGVVTARPGSGGGWELARPAAQVTLDEVWRAVHGEDAVLGLHHPNPACPVGARVSRVLTGLDARVATAVQDTLAARTVADTLAEARRYRPRRVAT